MKIAFFHILENVKKIKSILRYSAASITEDGIYQNISPKKAFDLITNQNDDRDIVILDVRSEYEYQHSHISGSVLLDFFSDAFIPKLEKLVREKTYIVFCKIGVRSKWTMELMKKMGFNKVYNIVGGEDQWTKDSLPYVYVDILKTVGGQ